ncbi:MAG: DinB family protein [Caldilineales bacterium]|nr:DinB family protein [Caldilineales bacterium]
MRIADIRLLYEYNAWATDRILQAAAGLSQEQYVASSSSSWGSIAETLTHAFEAEHIWRVRCQEGRSPTSMGTAADYPDVASLRVAWQAEREIMNAYLAGLSDADLDSVIDFKTTKGVSHRIPLWQILLHVLNHDTQHRSEVAMALTALGHSPGDLDQILFFRQLEAGGS